MSLVPKAGLHTHPQGGGLGGRFVYVQWKFSHAQNFLIGAKLGISFVTAKRSSTATKPTQTASVRTRIITLIKNAINSS